jgi:hypothetical protein
MNVYSKAEYVRGREFEPKEHGLLIRRWNHTSGLVNRALHSTLPRRYALNIGNSKLEIHDGEYYSGRDRPYEPSEVEYSP